MKFSTIKESLKIWAFSSLVTFLQKLLISLKFKFLIIFRFFIAPLLVRPLNKNNPIRDRRPTFQYVIEALSGTKPLVVETGCMRNDHGKLAWGDDGCSTLIFNMFVKSEQGTCISVDISEDNINYARKFNFGNGVFVQSDSVAFLEGFQNKENIDLLYLDSYDYDPSNPRESQEHHLSELLSVYTSLKSGCLILIDDADVKFDGTREGKATSIISFFDQLGISPKHSGYQILYAKP